MLGEEVPMKRMLVFAVVLFLLLLGLQAWAYDPDAPRFIPDVCRTPCAPAPIPIPYPNLWR
jgi:hypothetical protein